MNWNTSKLRSSYQKTEKRHAAEWENISTAQITEKRAYVWTMEGNPSN